MSEQGLQSGTTEVGSVLNWWVSRLFGFLTLSPMHLVSQSEPLVTHHIAIFLELFVLR